MNIKYILAMLLAINVTAEVYGQENPDVSYSKEKESLLKLNTSAFLGDLALPVIGNTTLGYFSESGKFRHPYTGKTKRGVAFGTEKFQRSGDWTFYGRFDFKTLKEKDLSFTSLVNPFTDNPYQIVDSLKGDWNKQFYDMAVKIASPLFAEGKMRAGLDLSYQVATGARQMDPRAKDVENKIHLAPNVTYRISERHQIGLAVNYDYWKNDLKLTRANINQQYNVYKLLGLGEYMGATPVIMTSDLTRGYIANRYGTELTYLYQCDQLRWLTSGSYLRHLENATDGTTYPMKAGKHVYDSYSLLTAIDIKRGSYNHHIDLGLSYIDIANTEYQQLQRTEDRSYETIFEGTLNTALRSSIALSYLLGKELGDYNSDWFAKASVKYSGWDNRYAIPQGKEILDRVDFGLRFNKSFSQWMIDLASNYSFSVKDEWNFTAKNYSSNFVANTIVLPIHQYLSSDQLANALSVQYRFRPSGRYNSQLYLKASGNVETALSTVGGIEKGQSRYGVSLALGVLTF